MGVQERRAREKQELRQEILAAARDLFIREGFENVSMRKIAEKIEYSPTTIYLYFQDKADLLDCICHETLSRLESILAALRESNSDIPSRLKEGLAAYIKFGLEHPNDYRVAFMMEIKEFLEPERCVRCHEIGQETFGHLRKDVAECIRLGVFSDRDVEATSQVLWAAIHGLTALLITKHHMPWADTDTLIDYLIDPLLEGLKSPVREAVEA